MTLREKRYTFADEVARLEERREELAEEAVELDADNPRKQILVAEGQELDTHLAGLRWAQDAHNDDNVPHWDDDVDGVTLAGLTGGEMGSLEDESADDPNAGAGTARVVLVAEGTVDAPYIDGGMEDFQQIAAVRDLPLPFLQWAESQINDLTMGQEGNGKSFGDLLVEKRETTSTSG